MANRPTKILLKKFEDEIILGGIYRSAAKGTDTEYSDLARAPQRNAKETSGEGCA